MRHASCASCVMRHASCVVCVVRRVSYTTHTTHDAVHRASCASRELCVSCTSCASMVRVMCLMLVMRVMCSPPGHNCCVREAMFENVFAHVCWTRCVRETVCATTCSFVMKNWESTHASSYNVWPSSPEKTPMPRPLSVSVPSSLPCVHSRMLCANR